MSAMRLRGYLFWLLVIIIILLIEFFLYRSHLRMTVVANGETLVLRKGSPLRLALNLKKIQLKPGDLLDRDGNLVEKGEGGPPIVLINGHRSVFNRELKQNDRISTHNGQDLYEQLSKKIEVLKPPVVVTGKGAFVSVEKHGLPGLTEVTLGEKSKRILAEKIVRNPSPTVVRRFDKQTSKIALTFDDGPSAVTPQIVAVLQEKAAPATFFVVGRNIQNHPAILKMLSETGYEIGNHTFSHSFLSKAPYEEIANEVDRTDRLILEMTGKRSQWFRPPGGKFSLLLLETVVVKNHKFLLWSVDPQDWALSNSDSLTSQVMQQTGPGSVILLHDGGGNQQGTVRSLPGIIDGLRAKGYTFVGLDELYQMP